MIVIEQVMCESWRCQRVLNVSGVEGLIARPGKSLLRYNIDLITEQVIILAAGSIANATKNQVGLNQNVFRDEVVPTLRPATDTDLRLCCDLRLLYFSATV
jgi:hypothetical protein